MIQCIWIGGVGVRHLLGYQKVSGSIPDVGNFSAWKCPDFRDNSRLGKETIPENSGLGIRTHTLFQIVRVGVGEFLGKLRSGNRYTIWIFKNPWRTPSYSKKFIQPTEGNCIPGQDKFDHWHPGWGPEQPVHFCISVDSRPSTYCTQMPLKTCILFDSHNWCQFMYMSITITFCLK